jgi:hypothetical protein
VQIIDEEYRTRELRWFPQTVISTTAACIQSSSLALNLITGSHLRRSKVTDRRLLHCIQSLVLITTIYGESRKIKQSLKGLDRAWGFQEVEIFRQLAHESGKFVSPMHRPPLPARKCSWYSFLLEAELTPGLQWDRKDYINEKMGEVVLSMNWHAACNLICDTVTVLPAANGRVLLIWAALLMLVSGYTSSQRY